MKRRLALLLVSGLLAIVCFVQPVLAGTVTVTGTLEAGDSQSGCGFHYDIFEFTVTQTGTYSMPAISPASYNGTDNFLLVFVSPNPSNPNIGQAILGRTNTSTTLSGTLTVGVTYYIYARGSGTCPQTVYPMAYSATISGPGDILIVSIVPDEIVASEIPEEEIVVDPQPAFFDGRINNWDDASPVAVYPVSTETGTAIHIYSDTGDLLLEVIAESIANIPANPASNLVIAEANGVIFSRLAGGLWQVNAPQYNGKTYVIIFSDLFSNGGYNSYEQ